MKFENYTALRKKVARLVKKGQLAAAVEILEEAKSRIPDRLYEITFRQARLYIDLGQYEKSLEAFEYGLQRNVVYPIWEEWDFWDPLRKYDRFEKILAENSRRQAEATARTEPQLRVVTPKGYAGGGQYPLFLVLHGWNDSLKGTMAYWRSKRLAKEFIVAYIQSSQVVDKYSFGWTDMNLGRKDIRKMYKKLAEEYEIDEKRVIVGGFSQGGLMALDAALSRTLPAVGFVVFEVGGGLPDSLRVDNLKKAAPGLRGSLIFGEEEFTMKEQAEILENLQAAGLDYRRVTTHSGHWYPKKFSRFLDEALAFVLPQ
jgi:predicted esterase